MKKSIAILLALAVIITSVFVACKKEPINEDTSYSEEGIEDAVDEFGFEEVPVTDKKGKEVTDKNGEKVTTEVAVRYEVDKKGKTVAIVLNDKGDAVTKKNGKPVTVKTKVELTTKSKKKNKNKKKTKKTTESKTTKTTAPTKSTTVKPKKDEKTTEPVITTKKNTDAPPETGDKGEGTVEFNSDDQQIVKSMLEVPFLYNSSYENAKGVPIEGAAHAAIWMLHRDNISTDSYAAGTVVIDLFKYFGQTVINFKSKVNAEGKTDNLIYKNTTDTFVVRKFEPKTHDVTIEKIETMGYGNYYKVTGTAVLYEIDDIGNVRVDKEGKPKTAGKKDIIAIIQRNRLDNTLGFSVKALKWS